MSAETIEPGLESYGDVLRAATEALDGVGVPYLVFGSLATTELGRSRDIGTDEDIDLFVRPPDVDAALAALAANGFVPQEHDNAWIHKARRGGVTVDVIFKAARRLYVDDEMLDRAVPAVVFGAPVRLIPPEDLVVMKALLHDEDRAFDWFDALSLVERSDLDWEYLVRRARAFGVHRVWSLLLFASTRGIDVPEDVLTQLRAASLAA